MPPKSRLKTRWWTAPPPGRRTNLSCGQIVHGDALDVLRSLRPQIADVLFLDPPFNLGKKYGKRSAAADKLAESDYREFVTEVISLSIDALRPGGALWLYHIPRWALQFGSTLAGRLTFQHWVAVSMKNGFVRGANLYPAHYALLHFTKGPPNALNRPKIQPLTCPHCGDFVRDYGGYADYVKDGVNLSDIWDDISPVRHQKYKTRTANELPLALGRRVLAISGVKGGLLVDPFAGSGTILLAGKLAGMRVIGCDREKENCDLIQDRLSFTRGKGRL